MAIPKIIHQLWKDEAVPARYAKLVESWRNYHPDWEYRLWTDADLRSLVAAEAPEFLKTYDGFSHPICRADAGRYFVLRKFGGIYADLDMEALRSLAPLLEAGSFQIGVEPKQHLIEPKVVARRFQKLLCPSLILSEPGHPFWDHVIRHMRQTPANGEPLDMTGPFLLTRAYANFDDKSLVKLWSAGMFYPLTKKDCWNGNAFSIEYWERKTKDAYATHYWDGSWFRKSDDGFPTLPPKPIVQTIEGSDPESIPAFETVAGDPLVSCLMVTRNRYELARLSLASFLAQTYENRELVVLDDGEDKQLAEEIKRLNDPRIRFILPTTVGLSLGTLRNQAVEAANGLYVCQWDDDDLYDPKRIEVEMNALREKRARAVMLHRVTIWMPARKRIKISHHRTWEGSMICEKAIMPKYPDQRAGEDTPLVDEICRRYRVAFIDMPRLYLYSFHGRNTWTSDHFEMFWSLEGKKYEGERYDAVRNELSKRLPVLEYEKLFTRVIEAAEHVSAEQGERAIGFNLFAHLEKNVGIAIAGRGTLAALSATRMPYTTIDLDALTSPESKANSFDADRDANLAINIIHTNPDALTVAMREGRNAGLDERIFEGRYNIGIWAWESGTTLSEKWKPWLKRFDEVWVGSEFTAQALRQFVSVPVIAIPHVVQLRISRLTRDDMNLPQDKIVFLTIIDGLSNVERKNTLGVIEAYKRAQPIDDKKAMLLIKARSLSQADTARIVEARAGREDIVVRIGDITTARMTGLIANCDALVSLHRAEGYGLTLAEAMEQGKPVIATNYSGNLEFTKPDNSFLVDAKLIKIEKQSGVYPAGTVWADPDLDQAAEYMRQIKSDPAATQKIARAGADFIHTHLNPVAIAKQIEARLNQIQSEGRLKKIKPAAVSPRMVPHVPVNATNVNPKILILTPIKDAERHLHHYARLLASLDYDPSRISLGLLEGDSKDGTFEKLNELLPTWRQRFRRVEILKHDYGLQLNKPRWAVSAQRKRREILARVRNRLLSEMLSDEDYVLWIDADVINYPADLIHKLLSSKKDIVVPRCIRPDGSDFDLNTFQFAPDRGQIENPTRLIDGIFQPPKGEGRRYLGDLTQHVLTPIDGVGGTVLMIRADLHREGLIFPAYSHRGYIETEGLAMMAKDMGAECWAMPQLCVVHAPD